MARFLLLLLVCCGVTAARADLRSRFPELVQPQAPCQPQPVPRTGVRITYLGTNAYLLESRDAVLLIDLYFSRMGILRCALKLRTKAEPERVDCWLRSVPRIDGVLVTHGHVDHLFDVPQILQRRPRAVLYAAQRSTHLAHSAGAPERQLQAVHPGSVVHLGGATVHVLRGSHDRILGRVPFPGPAKHDPPTHVDDWEVGETLTYLIEIGGKRIYLSAGSISTDAPSGSLGHIDLAIQGVADADALQAFPNVLRRLRPAMVLPSHQDDFFSSLDGGFVFLAGTDFPRVRKIAAEQHVPLILLDYFQPWTFR